MVDSDKLRFIYKCPRCKQCSFHAGPITANCPFCNYKPDSLGVILQAQACIDEYVTKLSRRAERATRWDRR